MTDLRDRHDEVPDQDIDFEELTWYATGKHVSNSLIGKKAVPLEFVVTEETHESMRERGFTHLEGQHYADDYAKMFILAEGDNSLEAHLRNTRTFTVNAIAMTPGKQSYHFPLINSFEEEDERAESPVNPAKDLKNEVIRHTTSRAVENADDFEQELERITERLPEFEIAEETQRLL